MPIPLANSAVPRRHRQQRLWFLRLLGHTARAILLLLSLAGLAILLLVQNSGRTQQLQDWLTTQITHGPKTLFRTAEQAMERKDYTAAGRAAREFMASVPLPLPVDAFGENYRTALRILRESAEKNGDLTTELAAGSMAQAFDPRDTAALFDYARALQTSGDLAGAASTLEAAFLIRPFSAAITAALESLYTRTKKPNQAAMVHARHLEAVALCLYQTSWLTGNIVYYGEGKTTAREMHLGFPSSTDLSVVLERETEGVYLVFTSLPHLRVIVEECGLMDPKQGRFPVVFDPQQALSRFDERTAVSTNPPGENFQAPAVIALSLPVKPTPGSTVHLRIRVEPDAELEPWVRLYGTWHHPRVPVAPAAGN